MLIRSVIALAATQAAADRPARVSDARQRASAPVEEDAVRKAAAAANEALRVASSTVEFTVAKDLGKTVVRVIDRETEEVIRQIPSEEMLQIAREIDRMQGLLLKGKA